MSSKMKKKHKSFGTSKKVDKASMTNMAQVIKEFFNTGFDNELRIQVLDPSTGRPKRIFGRIVDVLIIGGSIDGVFLKIHSDMVKRKNKVTNISELVSGDSTIIIPLASVIQAFSISFDKVEVSPKSTEDDEKHSSVESQKSSQKKLKQADENEDDDDEEEDVEDEEDDDEEEDHSDDIDVD